MRPNRMKSLFAAGEPALGCSVMIPSPQAVEMVGHAGFDWVLIDMEHGTIGPEAAELMTMAADAVGITPIVRPPTHASRDISAAMDRGAAGVQVPHVNTPEEAKRAVAAVKFGPGAGRGLAAGTRPDGYGLGAPMTEFVARSNAESLVCIQLEHAAAIENVDALLEVEGVDVFFVGPSDLSQSMGHPGNPGAAPVRRAIESTLARIAAAGKTPGLPAGDAAVRDVLAAGVRYTYTHLPTLVRGGASMHLRAARS